jgi:hypothetical protein
MRTTVVFLVWVMAVAWPDLAMTTGAASNATQTTITSVDVMPPIVTVPDTDECGASAKRTAPPERGEDDPASARTDVLRKQTDRGDAAKHR